MRRILRGIMALSCVLLFAPYAPAQDFAIENLCNPVELLEFDDESPIFALDYDELLRVRIELLERGFNPGFDSEPSAAATAQLMGAIAQYQAEYGLPVTGEADTLTLAALSVPIHKSVSEETPHRAKPSK